MMAWIQRSVTCRKLIGVALFLTAAAVVYTLYHVLLKTENYADFRYWMPSESDADDRLRVRLHWKPEAGLNPIVRTQVTIRIIELRKIITRI